MNAKNIGLLALGIAVGSCVTMLATSSRSPLENEMPARMAGTSMPAPPPADAGKSSSAEAVEPLSPRPPEATVSAPPPVAAVPAPSQTELQRAQAIQDRVLLKAGFTQERIDWIRQRTKELAQQARSDVVQRKPGVSAWSIVDRDWGLWDEMNEGEFVRYREAMGRPTSALVKATPPGSMAERVGLQSGDEIVNYDGKRVFSTHQLKGLTESAATGPIQVIVRRKGQTILLSAQPSAMDFETESPVEAAQREMTAYMVGAMAAARELR